MYISVCCSTQTCKYLSLCHRPGPKRGVLGWVGLAALILHGSVHWNGCFGGHCCQQHCDSGTQAVFEGQIGGSVENMHVHGVSLWDACWYNWINYKVTCGGACYWLQASEIVAVALEWLAYLILCTR